MSILRIAAALAVLTLCAAGQVINIGGGPIFDNMPGGGGGPINFTVHATGVWEVPLGETLTIQPSGFVKFIGGIPSRITVRGTLIVQGAPGMPAMVTSLHDDAAGGNTNGVGTPPSAGDWNGIHFQDGSTGVFRDAIVRFARVPIQTFGDTDLTIEDTTVSDSLFNVIDFNERILSNFTMTNVALNNAGTFTVGAIPIQNLPGMTNVTATGSTEGVRMNVVASNGEEVTTTLTVSPANTLNQDGVMFFPTGTGMVIDPGGDVTLEAGMVYKGQVSTVNVDGTLTCNGTASNPVVFTASSDDSIGGDTNGNGNATSPGNGGFLMRAVNFNAGSDASVIRHTEFRNFESFGSNCVTARSSVTFEDCLIDTVFGNTKNGFGCTSSATPTVRRCTVRNVSGVAFDDVIIEALPNFEDNVAVNCALGDFLRVDGSPLNGGFGHVVVTPRNYPGDVLVWNDSVTLQANDKLEFRDGVIMKVGGGILLDADDGSIDFRGTAFRPIILTSNGDDSIGGDTFKDGATALGSWAGVDYQLGSLPSTIEHALFRRFNSSIFSRSSSLVIRSLRMEDVISQAALRLLDAAVVDNVVVDGCEREGLLLSDGTFDVRHATVTGSLREGIEKSSNWSGTIINSIAFGNTLADFFGFQSSDLLNCLGAFDGVNGNIVADPLFVDAANGDLRLQAGSPCVDTADLATALALAADHDEAPRAAPFQPTAPFLADMGAFERRSHSLDAIGTGAIPSLLTFTPVGADLNTVAYIVGSAQGSFAAPPFGIVLAGILSDVALLTPNVPGTFDLEVVIPDFPVLAGFQFGCQALVFADTPGATGVVLTNMIRPRFF